MPWCGGEKGWGLSLITDTTPGGSELSESAFGYFITACAVIILTIICYLGLPRLVSKWRELGFGVYRSGVF